MDTGWKLLIVGWVLLAVSWAILLLVKFTVLLERIVGAIFIVSMFFLITAMVVFVRTYMRERREVKASGNH